MQNRKIIYTFLLSLLIFALILFAIISFQHRSGLNVVFINVGQGDSILISQGSNQILIDGGKDGRLLLEKLGKYIPFWDRKIEAVIVTHPDQDHIGGLIDVVRRYDVAYLLETNQSSESKTFAALEENIKIRNVQKIEAKKGVRLNLGGSEMRVIYPFASVADEKETNNNSIVSKLIYGQNEFLFTGDITSEKEDLIISEEKELESDYLKISHHGSKYATSEEFLNAIKPKEAIISVGKNNAYGHPNEEVIQRLLKSKINILRTDEIGDIVYECKNPDSECRISENYK